VILFMTACMSCFLQWLTEAFTYVGGRIVGKSMTRVVSTTLLRMLPKDVVNSLWTQQQQKHKVPPLSLSDHASLFPWGYLSWLTPRKSTAQQTKKENDEASHATTTQPTIDEVHEFISRFNEASSFVAPPTPHLRDKSGRNVVIGFEDLSPRKEAMRVHQMQIEIARGPDGGKKKKKPGVPAYLRRNGSQGALVE
jgi:hypothetical protein